MKKEKEKRMNRTKLFLTDYFLQRCYYDITFLKLRSQQEQVAPTKA